MEELRQAAGDVVKWALVAGLLLGPGAQPALAAPDIAPPAIVVQPSQINSTVIPWNQVSRAYIDAPLTSFTVDGTRYWFNSKGNSTALFQGNLDQPFQSLLWNRPNTDVFSGSQPLLIPPDGSRPAYWIVNLYQAPTGLLALIHVEMPVVRDGYHTGHTRIGLAWSADEGQHFSYLGDILAPSGDPDDFNIQGGPYLIKDGYFYLFYSDKCGEQLKNAVAVARAPLADVIAAAQHSGVTTWEKYSDGQWSGSGVAGTCTGIDIHPQGITHTSAAYSSYTHKYYLLLSRSNAHQQDSWIKLFESADLIHWSFDTDIIDAPADASNFGFSGAQLSFQYVSIIDSAGGDNAVVGRKFYVYSGEGRSPDEKVYRWLVDLSQDGP